MTGTKIGKADAPELSALLLKNLLLEQASKQLSSSAEPLALQPPPCPLPEHKTHVLSQYRPRALPRNHRAV